jgi:hypothetical protein
METITPNTMKQRVEVYNKHRHKTLTRLMGFPATPNIAEKDKAPEKEILTRISAENHSIMRSEGYELAIGRPGALLNPPTPLVKRRSPLRNQMYTIAGPNGCYYVLGGAKGTIFESSGRPIMEGEEGEVWNGRRKLLKASRTRLKPLKRLLRGLW